MDNIKIETIKVRIKNLVERGYLKEAEEIIVKVEEVIAEDIEIQSIKGVIQILKNNLTDAKQIFIKGIDRFGELFDFTYNLAYIFEKEKDNKMAYYYYSKSYDSCEDEVLKLQIKEKVQKLSKEDGKFLNVRRKK